MTTFTELLTSLKDEFSTRYRSPFWGVALLALIACHWKIVLFFVLEKPRINEAMAFIEVNANSGSILGALLIATIYIIAFPWIELVLAMLASFGKNLRNDFQFREMQKENSRRKLIALQESRINEIEIKNREDQSKLADIELAKTFQNLLSGENFNRWLKDAKSGAINTNLSNSINNYLYKADAVEGKFINPDIEEAHEQFIEAISTLNSAIYDSRPLSDNGKQSDIMKFTENALQANQKYRTKVRLHLGV